MKLQDTVGLMTSSDYKERFIAEYKQLVIRRDGLTAMLDKWTKGELDFTPTCPIAMYDTQLKAMNDYALVLETRALLEDVNLK